MSGAVMPDEATGSGDFMSRAQEGHPSILQEMWDFIRENKKWWLVPIVLVLLALGALVTLGGTGLAPFIYAIF